MKKRVLITGATSGIGRELAKEFSEKEWELVLLGRSQTLLDQLVAELTRDNSQVETRCLDLTQLDQVSAIDLEKLNLDMVINCAGVGTMGDFKTVTEEQEMEMVRVNLLSTMILSKKSCLAFAKKGHGQLINVCSTAAFYPNPGLNVYSATKAFVLAYTLGLSQEVRRYSRQIKVLTICPGPTRTHFFDKAVKVKLANDYTSQFEMSPQKVARLVVANLGRHRRYYIVGHRNRWLTKLINLMPLSWQLSLIDGYIRKGWE